jgi:hypothetical protein
MSQRRRISPASSGSAAQKDSSGSARARKCAQASSNVWKSSPRATRARCSASGESGQPSRLGRCFYYTHLLGVSGAGGSSPSCLRCTRRSSHATSKCPSWKTRLTFVRHSSSPKRRQTSSASSRFVAVCTPWPARKSSRRRISNMSGARRVARAAPCRSPANVSGHLPGGR